MREGMAQKEFLHSIPKTLDGPGFELRLELRCDDPEAAGVFLSHLGTVANGLANLFRPNLPPSPCKGCPGEQEHP